MLTRVDQKAEPGALAGTVANEDGPDAQLEQATVQGGRIVSRRDRDALHGEESTRDREADLGDAGAEPANEAGQAKPQGVAAGAVDFQGTGRRVDHRHGRRAAMDAGFAVCHEAPDLDGDPGKHRQRCAEGFGQRGADQDVGARDAEVPRGPPAGVAVGRPRGRASDRGCRVPGCRRSTATRRIRGRYRGIPTMAPGGRTAGKIRR